MPEETPEEITLARIKLAKARENIEIIEDGVEKCDISHIIRGTLELSKSLTTLIPLTERVADIDVSEARQLEKEIDELNHRFIVAHSKAEKYCECKRK